MQDEFLNAVLFPERYINTKLQEGATEDKKVQQDIGAAGYLGMPQGRVQEQRGVFGSVLQGLGLLDQPQPRELTPFEQYLYQRGQHARGIADFETEKERVSTLQGEENLGQDVAKTGQMPSGAPWNLPPEMGPGFENIVKDYNATSDYTTKKRQADLEAEGALKTERLQRQKYNEEMLGQMREQKHMDLLKKWGSMPAVQEMVREYHAYMNQAVNEPSSIKKSSYIAQAAQVQQRLRNYFNTVAVPTHDLSPADVDVLSNMGANVFDPLAKQTNEERIVQTPQDVDKALSEIGVSSQQFPFGAP